MVTLLDTLVRFVPLNVFRVLDQQEIIFFFIFKVVYYYYYYLIIIIIKKLLNRHNISVINIESPFGFE